MSNFNRIKVVLTEDLKIGEGLAEQLGKSNFTVSKLFSNTTNQI